MKKIHLDSHRILTRLITLGAMVFFLTAFSVGCQDNSTSNSDGDKTAPTVSETFPTRTATSIAMNSAITASFDEAMNSNSFTTTTFSSNDGTSTVDGAVSYVGNTAVIKPLSNMTANTVYTTTITTGVKDLADNGLAADYSWDFTTGDTVDTTAPTVLLTSPVDADTNIATNSAISVSFNKTMNPATVSTASFTLSTGTTPVAGTVSYSGTMATFRPLSDMALSATYTATITTGVTDLAGNALAADYSWDFTTGATTDTTAPTVLLTSPVNEATNVATNSAITASFTEPMDSVSVTATTFTLKAGITPVSGTVSYLGSTAKFTLLSDLALNTTYTATITTGVKDLAGNTLAADYAWTFTTGATTALGPASVNLGTAGNFVILAKSGISTTGTTAIVGNLGISPAALSYITGFNEANDSTNVFATSSLVTGKIYASNMAVPTPANMTTAISDMQLAYTDAAGRITPDFLNVGAGTLSGVTLTPGLHKWSTGLAITTDITIAGSSNDIWILQVDGNLIVSNGVKITLSGGALPENIFWQVAGQSTLGTTSEFKGIILCQTLIQMQTGAAINGRALAQTDVTLDATAVTQP